MATNNNTEVTLEIMEHIGVLDTYDNREQAKKLTKSLVERYRAKEDLNKTTPMRNDMAR